MATLDTAAGVSLGEAAAGASDVVDTLSSEVDREVVVGATNGSLALAVETANDGDTLSIT